MLPGARTGGLVRYNLAVDFRKSESRPRSLQLMDDASMSHLHFNW
jgi:hypothetical protein